MDTSSRFRLDNSRVVYVCGCTLKRSLDYYRLYIIELRERSQPEFDRRPPSLRISSKYFNPKSFCLFHSELLMFDPSGVLSDPYQGRRVLIYKIPPCPLFNYKVKHSDLYEAPFLNHPKMGVDGVATPGGNKFLVFSTRICKLNYGQDETCLDFELYDPAVKSWLVLPGISCAWRMKAEIHMEAHCMINNVLVCQTNIGFFVMDMEKPEEMMKNIPYDVPIPTPPRVRHLGIFIAIASHDMYLTPNIARDIGRGVFFQYPNVHPLGDDYSWAYRNITLMRQVEGKECIFCISRAEVNMTTLRPRLIIDLYRLDLVKYSEEMEKKKKEDDGLIEQRLIQKEHECLPATRLLKSFKFHLSTEATDDQFYSLALFSLH